MTTCKIYCEQIVMAKTSGCGFGGIFGKQGNRESIGIVEGAIVSLDIKLKQ